MMKSIRWIGACALIAIMLSGCGTKAQDQAGTANAAGSTQQTETKQDAQQAQNGQQGQGMDMSKPKTVMTEQERQMMMTFQTLVRMDKTDGLAITKEQAQAMLPVVQDGIAKKELSTDAHAKLTEKLTAEQKKFVDDAAARMQQRANNAGGSGSGIMNPPAAAGDAQKPADGAGKPQADAGGKGGSGSDGSSGGQGGKGGPGDNGGQGGNGGPGGNMGQGDKGGQGHGGNGGPGGMQNAGQQLADLLQSKSK